jgi:hypothetical protein
VTRPHWQWVLVRPVTGGGATVAELTEARSRRIEFPLDGPAKAGFTFPGRHPQVRLVDEVETDVLIARDGLAVFRGRINTSEDTISETVHTCTFGAIDYRGMLDRRIVWPGSTLVYTGADQAAIAADLIADTQALGTLGITLPATTTGVARDRTYETGAVIGELITNLGRCLNGFDWDISPALALRIWYPARGATTPVFVAEYGRTVTSLRRTVSSSDFANAIRYSGADAVPAALRTVTPGIEGRWERQIGDTNLTTPAAVNESADGAIVELSGIEPAYQVTLAPGAWTPATVWLGDVIRLLVRSGRLDVDTTTRVVGVNIDLDDDGNETIALAVGPYRWRLSTQLADYRSRLDLLERR